MESFPNAGWGDWVFPLVLILSAIIIVAVTVEGYLFRKYKMGKTTFVDTWVGKWVDTWVDELLDKSDQPRRLCKFWRYGNKCSQDYTPQQMQSSCKGTWGCNHYWKREGRNDK